MQGLLGSRFALLHLKPALAAPIRHRCTHPVTCPPTKQWEESQQRTVNLFCLTNLDKGICEMRKMLKAISQHLDSKAL